jgi:CheY-like chemotaxis protein/signal transduction histidine kinase
MPEQAPDDRCLAGLAAALAGLPTTPTDRLLAGFAEALGVDCVVLLDPLEPGAGVRAIGGRERRHPPEQDPVLPAACLAAFAEGRLFRGGRELAAALVRAPEPPGAALLAPLPALAGPPWAALGLIVNLSGWTWSIGQEQALRGLAGGLAGWHAARQQQAVLDALPQRIAWKDAGLRVRGANRAHLRHGPVGLGRPDPGDDEAARRRELAVLAGGPAHVQRVESTALPGGRESWSAVHRVPLEGGGLVVARDDITAAVGLAGQLAQAHRTAAIGGLATGVADDLRPLAADILADVAAARDAPDPGPALARIELAARTADDLARQLAAFSRRQLAAPVDVVPAQLLARMEPTLARLLGERVELRLAPVGLKCQARVDPRLFEQLLALLARHLRDVLGAGGRVDVDVGPDTHASDHLALAPGEYVRVRLQADPAPAERPAPADPEHGLRLALARAIAAQAGGAAVQRVDADARVHLDVYLPRVFSGPRGEPDVGRPVTDVRGGEAVLLVDDDPLVRPLVAAVLRHLGYRVHAVDDVERAVQLLATGPCVQVPSARVALALVSATLPGQATPDVLRRLRAAAPELRVLWIVPHGPAGHGSGGPISAAPPPPTGVDPLVVPCSFEALAARVRQALDARA